MPLPPVSRFLVIESNCNGPFKIVTDMASAKEFKLFEQCYIEWFDNPLTKDWVIESFLIYFKQKYPDKICLLYADYERIIKNKMIPATREEWEAEQN